MEYNELVSIVMPVHNGERFLREAIEGVLNQTYTNFEFLIIENCSTDSSVEIIKSYKDSRIRLIVEEDCGIVQGYNRGFKEAKGEYIIIHDHDDVSLPKRIELLLEYSITNKLDICGSSFMIIDDKNEKIKIIFPPTEKKEILNRILFDCFALFNPNLIIKKEVLVNLNYFKKQYPIGADYDFILSALRKYNYGNTEKLLLKYRYHKNSTSRQNKSSENLVYKMSLQYFEKFKEFYDDNEFIQARIYYYYGKYLNSLKHLIKSFFNTGIKSEKIQLFLLLTIFILPILILRKRGFYYNKNINKLLEFVRKSRFSISN